ncbi:uncharacterized protein GGS25DRAFT_409934 [Hypoxylon fragiforme]|uniref:uncharacterized protein n=1 Tax=Hypoxylon fragiforme TaxID=63214 RepID=UPI0020C64F51|nr:uncharacterized protein GGS25DRAFT_409934 [Hypoxylon fragiforme]KAI2605008.1 hypothetical protein GGS25DRAFT_409934 [Hypoxylon fragiforme]
MTSRQGKSFVEKSRFDRRAELVRVARDRHADIGFILGLSWRAKGKLAHLDYAGGLDTNKIRSRLARLAKFALWEDRADDAGFPRDEKRDLPSLKDALLDSAPVDVHHETVDRQERIYQRRLRGFAGIISQIDTEALASFALGIMQTRRNLTSDPDQDQSPLRLPRIRGPSLGSAHVFYSIAFYDAQTHESTKWIIKIPANGTPDTWDKLSSKMLRTEALVLYMLRTETSVPVPEIIDADSSPHNELHVPYLIMEYVEGQPLDRVWFGEGGEDENRVRERKIKILRNLARAMLQLGKYEFDRGGAPVFDDDGAIVGAGPLRELDVQAMVERWFDNENCEGVPLYAEIGTFGDPAEMYTAMIDRYQGNTEANAGVDRLLHLLVGLIQEKREKKKFVLTHSDLSMRHILVSKQGQIKAILGWDAARISPKSMGNESYPRWLVRDFNPFIWRWLPAPEFWRSSYEEPQANRVEDAPWVLRELRDEYAKILMELKEQQGIDADRNTADVKLTKQSLFALSLDVAARDPRCRAAILRKILDKCSRASEEFEFTWIVEALGNGRELGEYKRKCLEKNIEELVNRGYVRGAIVR